jgi:hypothetical protein
MPTDKDEFCLLTRDVAHVLARSTLHIDEQAAAVTAIQLVIEFWDEHNEPFKQALIDRLGARAISVLVENYTVYIARK